MEELALPPVFLYYYIFKGPFMMTEFFKTRKTILYSFFLTLLFFGINYRVEFATDTYYNFIQKGAWVACLDNGRPFLALCFYILESLPISVGMIYHIMQLLGIAFLTAATALLAGTYNRYMESETIAVVLSFLTIANPLIIEYFLFEEKGIFMLAILLNVIAALITERTWRKQGESSAKEVVLSALFTFLCMLVAVLSYQTSVQVFVVICLPFIVIYSRSALDFVKKNIYVAILYGASMGCALAVAKYILHTERAVVSMDLQEGFARTAGIIRDITADSFYHLHKGEFFLWCLILAAIMAISLIKAEEGRIKLFLSYAYIWVGCLVASFFIFVLNGSALPSPRTVYTYGMLFGVILFYSAIQKKKNILNLALAVAVIILAMEYISFGSVFIDRYQCNEADRYYAQLIREQIREYEDETGNEIDTISYYKDATITWWDEGYGDTMLMSRAQSCGWSALNSLNFYLGREYKEGEQDPEIAEYFSQKDWGMYSEDQLIFKDNVLHICVY